MIARRELLKWGVIAPALVGGSSAAFGRVPQGIDALVLDTRLVKHAPEEMAGVPVHRFHGDVTQLWFETLDPVWRKPGFTLGGITAPDALFVLETLAHDRGRRVISRKLLPSRLAPQAPVSWVIAPVHPSVKV